ncbi:hypothetical protein OAT84_04215, partial [Gammaproteobacteria bacterium]|nr:hypothetical protein [Gammaproteobacteria bacterium]
MSRYPDQLAILITQLKQFADVVYAEKAKHELKQLLSDVAEQKPDASRFHTYWAKRYQDQFLNFQQPIEIGSQEDQLYERYAVVPHKQGLKGLTSSIGLRGHQVFASIKEAELYAKKNQNNHSQFIVVPVKGTAEQLASIADLTLDDFGVSSDVLKEWLRAQADSAVACEIT